MVATCILPAVGIDVGLEAFLTTSDGKRIENPRYQKAELPKLRRLQRATSRKKKGGRNRKKASHRVRVLHARVRNLRHEHHHQTALFLIRLYGLIGIEKLTVNCWSCDEDNPFAVPPDRCPVCKGSKKAPVAFASILKEIHGSRAELNKTSSADDTLYLEY